MTTSSTALTELSLTSSASVLHETFAAFRQSVRERAAQEIKVTLPRRVHVLRHVLNTSCLNGHLAAHHPNPNQSSSSSEEDVTKTPRKKRRVSDEFIADENIGADDDLVGGGMLGNDDGESVAQTPVPHGIHGHGGIHQELGQKGFFLSHGINEDVKELMRVVKREISQLVHCVSHIKTWIQLDSIHVPKCNIQEEITGIEKWGMETLESFPAYHAKRGQLLRDYATELKANDGALQDLKEAVLELDDVQMQHLIMTLQEAMQISAVLYTHLDGVVVEDV